MIVADTGPLIAFIGIGRLDILQHIVGTLSIPDAVYEELTKQGQDQTRAAIVNQNPWIQRTTVVNRGALSSFPSQLHAGEREAILLAEELGT